MRAQDAASALGGLHGSVVVVVVVSVVVVELVLTHVSHITGQIVCRWAVIPFSVPSHAVALLVAKAWQISGSALPLQTRLIVEDVLVVEDVEVDVGQTWQLAGHRCR